MQDVEDFPSLLHSTAGPSVLSNGGDGAQNGSSVLSLQSAAAHNHHRALSCWKDLETFRGNWTFNVPLHMAKRSRPAHYSALGSPRDVCVHYLVEGVCAISQLLQYRSVFSQVVICVTQVHAVTHHGNTQLIVEPAERGGQRGASGTGSAKDATQIHLIMLSVNFTSCGFGHWTVGLHSAGWFLWAAAGHSPLCRRCGSSAGSWISGRCCRENNTWRHCGALLSS